MKPLKVGALMTDGVVSVVLATPFREVAELLAEHDISGLPVRDRDGVVAVVDRLSLGEGAPGPATPARSAHEITG
ncbi:CBS domain-containing protein [Streptomyces tritici]|uniref:CBS domain-containing protein n=1 Tax=Streptomyces tritici TaxID=2054410 RepID=UPI003AEFC325